jgi:uncharacterized membrane protein YidH (DUF202 family)
MAERAVQDAIRRTRLANERTYLAWWRSGLTALAVSSERVESCPSWPVGRSGPTS